MNRSFNSAAATKCSASDPDQLKSAREDIKELLNTKFCHPILVRSSLILKKLLRFIDF